MTTPGKWTYFVWRGCPACHKDDEVVFRFRDGMIESKCGCGDECKREPLQLAESKGNQDAGHYTEVHRFINQTPDFVLGFEAGRFYEDCIATNTRSGHFVIEGMFHTRNEGELLSIARHHGFVRTKWERLDDNWAEGIFRW